MLSVKLIYSILWLIIGVLRGGIIIKHKKDYFEKRSVLIGAKLLFLLYIAFMIYVLFLSPHYNRAVGRVTYNLIPFRTIIGYIKYYQHYSLENWLTNLLGNVVVFMPLGFFLPISFKKMDGYKMVLFLTFGSSLAAESLQRFLRVGSFDVDDIILNTIGGVLGYLVYRVLFRKS